MKRWLFRGIAIAVGIVALAAIVYGLAPKPLPVDAADVRRGALATYVEEEGKTRVRDRFTVPAPVSGVVARVEVEPGDAVKEGEILTVVRPSRAPLLDPQARASAEAALAAAVAAERQANAAIERVSAVVEGARTSFDRASRLHRGGAISQSQLDEARTTVDVAESDLSSARFAAQVAAHQVRSARAVLGTIHAPSPRDAIAVTAPVSGEVLRVLQESETPVMAGAPLLEVGDVNSLDVVADVLTRDAIQLRPGMPARLEEWGGVAPLRARVRIVEPSAFTEVSALGVREQRVKVVLDFEGERGARARLGDGFAVNVRFVTFEAEDVLKLPRSALFRSKERWAAFVVRDGRARLVPVEVGHLGASEVEVLSGIAAGERVVLHPGDTVFDGARVRAR